VLEYKTLDQGSPKARIHNQYQRGLIVWF